MGKKTHILPYDNQTLYQFKTHNLSYTLPLIKVERNKYIVWLNTLGDAKLINLSAKIMAKELENCDILVTLESYGIEFTHALATLLKQDKFIVCRTSKHAYMSRPIHEYWGPKNNIKSAIFYLDSKDAKLLKGKKVGIVDEIVGAGRAMNAMEKLVKRSGGRVTKKIAIFSDGITYTDIDCLDTLPIFIKP
jgi:adenine/guanine phosphoribosyltransferase-like PRPP-binding protein